jgi:pimeloyl-ACP methyl ester carboxylesterase
MCQPHRSVFPISAHAEEHDPPPGKSRPGQEQEHTAVPANPLLRRLVPAAAAAALLATVLPASAAVAAARPASPGAAVPVLHWRPCDGGFQCATARVPLDYRHPRGATITIAMIRHLATDPARRIGSLFFNPGGPGGSGTEDLPLAYRLFPAAARARFDLVSFDPRGVGRSTAVRCFPTARAEDKFLARLPAGFPVGARQDAAWERGWARFDAICAARADPGLLVHDTTADVARDMDLLRQAVHDPVLNYLGVSYGTMLGATYANLFPSRVGAMILDGNINPVAWTRGGRLPTSLRMGTDESAAATLRSFLGRCGQVPATRCAFSAGSPAATRAKFAALLRRLRGHPVQAGPQRYTYASTISAVSQFLYTVKAVPAIGYPGWPAGASLLQHLWTASAPGRHAPLASPPALYNGVEQQAAVACSDSPNPPAARYPALARFAKARSGVMGLPWTWLSEGCAGWPGSSQDRYAGPWNRPTAHPMLVIGNTTDPATPYAGSVVMSRLLARARLLTVHGYGHTELLNPSTCAARYESRYLLTGALPPAGTVCQQNGQPFPG